MLQLREKRAVMEAALAAREEGDGDGAAADNMSDVSSVVSGLSAYTQRSAAATSAPTSTGSFAPSTVGGRRPQKRQRQKVCTASLLRRSFRWTAIIFFEQAEHTVFKTS